MRTAFAHFVAEPGGVWTVHFGDVPVGRIVPDGGRFAVRFACRGPAFPDTRHDELRIAETYCLGVLASLQFEPMERTSRATSR